MHLCHAPWEGLYGVSSSNLGLAAEFARGDDRLVKFPLSPGAHIVDITHGEGAGVWKLFQARGGGSIEDFAKHFGIDILRYPYPSEAFVVKNAAVLGRPEGHSRKLLSSIRLAEMAGAVDNDEKAREFLEVLGRNGNPVDETLQLVTEAPYFSKLAKSGEGLARLARLLRSAHFDSELVWATLTNDLDPEREGPFVQMLRDLERSGFTDREQMAIAFSVIDLETLAAEKDPARRETAEGRAVESLHRLLWLAAMVHHKGDKRSAVDRQRELVRVLAKELSGRVPKEALDGMLSKVTKRQAELNQRLLAEFDGLVRPDRLVNGLISARRRALKDAGTSSLRS